MQISTVKTRRTATALIAAMSLSGLCVAQEDYLTRERSSAIIRKGIELHDEKKFDESVAEFKKVHRNDSNYYLASVEILNSYLADKKNEEGLALCDELLKLKNDYTPNILIYKADFLDNLKRHEEAEKIYKQGEKDYPLNHQFFYEQAVVNLNRKEYDKAFENLVKCVKVNPFHASSHYQLGMMAYRANNLPATMMAFQYFLLCENTSQRGRGVVSDLEKVVKLELEFDTAVIFGPFKDQNNFTELESILRSRIAFTDKYKTKTDLNFNLTKQVHLLTENIGKYAGVKGFYNDYYGRFFTELQKEKFFEEYAHYMLKGMGLEQVDKWLKKNKSDVDKFETWAYNWICNNLAKFPDNAGGEKIAVPHWYQGNYIAAAGAKNKKDENDGYWVYYFRNGIRKSEGEFVNGSKNKGWKYYFNSGGISEEAWYDNGNEKKYKSYYENNNPRVELDLLNGKVDGEKKSYYSNGNISAVRTYKQGDISGRETYYYRNGTLRYSIDNEKGVLNGELTEYFDNGKIYQKCRIVNNNVEGPAKTFYNNAGNTVESEGNYLKDKRIGEWKNYFSSGKLYKTQPFNNDGLFDGTVVEYYENGKTDTEEAYSNGKLNGLTRNYTDDGVLWQEFVYKKGKLLEYRAFRKDGSKICDNKINGKNFAVVLYHPNGEKRREGKVSDGELDGVWKDYSLFGVLTRESNYKEGKLDGKYVEYHPNGKIKTEKSYVDGKATGYYRSFYINGNPYNEGMLVDGDNQGYWKTYYKDGSLESKLYYYDDRLDGWNEYYSVSGKLSNEDLYRENCLIKVVYHDTSGVVTQNIDLPGGNGMLEEKNINGQIIFRKKFVNDYPDSLTTTYWPDGKLKTTVTYVKGKKEGKWQQFSHTGRLQSEISYFNNQKNGREIDYYDNGKVASDYNFLNGDYHGTGYSYFENGKVFKELNYYFGDAEGESNMFDDSGELIYKRYFHRDLLTGYTYKDAKGQLVKPLELQKGNNKVICYYQNGKKSFEANYTDGELNGKRTIYYSNGKKMDEGEFYFGSRNGLCVEYYSNGNPKMKENLYYGSLDGKSESFYENGKLKAEIMYSKGDRHGWTKYFDENGKLTRSVLYYNGSPVIIR